MESSLSDLQFSVSEFEQAGLRPDVDNEVFSRAGASPAPHEIDGPPSGVESTSDQSGNLTQDSGLVRPVVSDQNLLPGPWDTPNLLHASCAAGRDVQHQQPGPVISIEPYSKKQQQNREHQKRFRQRQKVLGHFDMAADVLDLVVRRTAACLHVPTRSETLQGTVADAGQNKYCGKPARQHLD